MLLPENFSSLPFAGKKEKIKPAGVVTVAHPRAAR
jgi:hypothetical protein